MWWRVLMWSMFKKTPRRCQRITLRTLWEQGETILSKISEFATRQNAFNDRLDAAVTDLQGDVATLNAKIEELQNSPGEITPEDQASLDAIETRAQSITDKLEALAAVTPPAVPTE